jgi:hypothetical protein
VAREIERRHVRARPARPRLWLTVAAAVGCAVLLWLARDFTYIRDSADVTQRGQQPHLVIFRKTPTGVERLTTQARVRAGDMLQLAYVAAGRKYGVIASSDGRATVAFHLPEHEEVAVRLSDQGQSALPHAFELDDTPGSERFVFISADEPFSTDVVADALQSGFPLGKRYTLHEITLEKLP